MVVDRIKEARYDFYSEQFDRISLEAKEFISALLQKNSEYRMSAGQAIQHDWITVRVCLVPHSFDIPGQLFSHLKSPYNIQVIAQKEVLYVQ